MGAGLPAKAVGQHRMHQLTHRLREQARSHRGFWYGSGMRVYGDQMWELACLRKRWVSCRMHQLTHRLREQARSHRGSRV
ncbi:hypothetical protein C9382_17925 [Pseudomonas aylmerensis]|uniref:Uncharacterized protein n=1 Tax=Pseudomonas aylmerensis TaxID=1869229 RepID=A0A2T4FUI6_9PSED|nr:hypothetical protein C9382_17925 [Pseudomonas aylmerensis]